MVAEQRDRRVVALGAFEALRAKLGTRGEGKWAILRGDWKTPCNFLPNLLAGYAIYDLSR